MIDQNVLCLSYLTGLQLAETTGARRRAGPQDATMRSPPRKPTEELLPPLDVKVPNQVKADRCYLPNHIPIGLCAVQLGLLVSLNTTCNCNLQ